MMDDQYSRYRSMSQQANPYNDLPEQPSPQRAAIGNVIGGASNAAQGPSPMSSPTPRGTAPSPYVAAQPRPIPTRSSMPVGQPQQYGPPPQQGPPRNGGGTIMNPGGQLLPPQSQAPMTPAAQGGLGAFGGKLEGFDMNKMNSGHDSPKYQFGRVMSQFDPKGGITQDMLNALNALGLGTVSGNIGGDKIQLGGNIDPRFNGETGFDLIRDLENGGGWQWGALSGGGGNGGGQVGQAIGGMGGMLGQLLGNAGGAQTANPMGGGNYSDQIMRYLMQQLAINKTLGGQ